MTQAPEHVPVCLCLSESESESESVPVPVSVSMSVSMSVPVSVSVSVSVSVCLWQDSQQDDGVALARRLRAIGCLQEVVRTPPVVCR